MKARIWISLAAALGFALPAIGDEVGTITTFQANTPALASEVNANFQALISAIDDNAQRIVALEGATVSNDVSGGTYRVVELEVGAIETGAGIDVSAIGFGFSFSGTITFAANGTGSVNGSAFEFESGPGLGVDSLQENESIGFTYSQNGSQVTITDTDDGDVTTFHVSQSGEVMTARTIDFSTSAPDEADTNILIAIRQ